MTFTIPAPGEVLRWLGGQIDVRVEIDTGLAGATFGIWGVSNWGQVTWGSQDPLWNDITHYVNRIIIDRGASKWTERFQTGTATIVLSNESGVFTPDSGVTSPWHLTFRPGRRIRVIAIPDPDNPLDKKSLFTGEIDASYDALSDAAFSVEITLPCTDSMATWADHNPPALETPTGVQSTSARVTAALDRMSWPAALRDIQTGVHTMQSSFLAQTTLEECEVAADAEGGAFFCSADGKATFKARDWLSTDTRSIDVQGYLGYEQAPAGENAHLVLEFKTSTEIARVVNQVRFARIGSTMQEVNDSGSQALFDVRSYPRTDFQNNTDAEVLFLATRYLDQGKDLRLRIEEVTIGANDDPLNADLNHLFWAAEFGDLLSLLVDTPHGWSYEKLVKIMGIHHEISGEDWTVTFRLDDVFTYVGGSIATVEVTAFGGGERTDREGGSLATVGVSALGGGTGTSKEGGSVAQVLVVAEGEGIIPRIDLMTALAPEAWWRFGAGGVSNLTLDSSGNGHTLTWTGSPLSNASAGPIEPTDAYIATDGVNDFATVASEAALELRSDMSIEMWIRPHDASGTHQTILCCRGTGTDAGLYEVTYNPDLDRINFWGKTGEGGDVMSSVPVNTWTHVVLTLDWGTSSNTLRLYRNGSLTGTPTGLGQPGALTRAINIGRKTPENNQYFDGDISELTIFDRVLTEDEVRQLYESTYQE